MNQKEPAAHNRSSRAGKVVVTVRGGVAEIVPPIPLGIVVEIRDYDVDEDDKGLNTDFEGEKYLSHREGDI